MIETIHLMLATSAGLLFGTIFYGGLWWTVNYGITRQRPTLWFIGSLCIRMSIALIGIYFVSLGHWQQLVFCLLGFITARLAISWFTRMPQDSHPVRAPETPHAS